MSDNSSRKQKMPPPGDEGSAGWAQVLGWKWLDRMLAFCRALRRKGVPVSSEETLDAIRLLEHVEVGSEREFWLGLRLILCTSRENQKVFDDVYRQFFHERQGIEFTRSRDDRKKGRNERGGSGEGNSFNRGAGGEEATRGGNSLRRKDGDGEAAENTSLTPLLTFSGNRVPGRTVIQIPSDPQGEMKRAARELVSRMHRLSSRRRRPASKGDRLHFRRTWRKNAPLGGFFLQWCWYDRRPKQIRWVLLCDGSRSMQPFSERFLQFARALARQTAKVEVFLFSTHIRRVTQRMQREKTGESLSWTGLQTEWGGGTRIGESLATFVGDWGMGLLNRDTLVIIFSDGLDTGATEKLEWAMRALQQQSAGVVWLNPLLGIHGYRPVSRGMQTALPYIDIFAEGHDVDSYQRLSRRIRLRR